MGKYTLYYNRSGSRSGGYVLPCGSGHKKPGETDAKKQLLSANDTISTNGQTISGLNDQIDKLKKELEDEKKKMMEYQTRFPHMRLCSMPMYTIQPMM